VQTWARIAPADFLATAAAELNGTALAASYGPPYNHGTGAAQQVGPVNWQNLAGVTQPIDTAQSFVLSPLAKLAPTDPPLAAALTRYDSAPAAQRTAWAAAYGDAVTKVKFIHNAPVVPAAGDGPVPALMTGELTMARSGALDADLLAQRPFYGTDFTRPRPRAPEAGHREAGVKAHVGDRLVVNGDESRTGLIIGLQHADWSPPYVVQWLADGHIALVYPGRTPGSCTREATTRTRSDNRRLP
jgi:hypothetical protein